MTVDLATARLSFGVIAGHVGNLGLELCDELDRLRRAQDASLNLSFGAGLTFGRAMRVAAAASQLKYPRSLEEWLAMTAELDAALKELFPDKS